jgi:RimJ/RimL family protein N-acetyltransferase
MSMLLADPTAGHHHGVREVTRCRAAGHARCDEIRIAAVSAEAAEAAVVEIFEAMSDEARYYRFLGPMPRLSAGAQRVLSTVERGRHEMWTARCDGRTVGLVRIVRDRTGRVELAVEIADSHGRQGIATRLIEAALEGARSWGEQSVYLLIHPRNRPALELFRRLGAELGYDGGLILGTLSVTDRPYRTTGLVRIPEV